MRTCRQCGAPIVGRLPRAVFCSLSCRRAAELVKRRKRAGAIPNGKKRECPVCTMPFKTKGSRHRFCSSNCAAHVRMAKYLAKKRGEPKRHYVSKALQARRAAAEQLKAAERRKKREAAAAERRKKREAAAAERRKKREAAKRLQQRLCLMCGAPISRSKPGRYCDHKCRGAHASQLAEEKGLRAGTIPTPEQIRERAEAIQATWTEREREAHLTAKPTIFHVPGTI